MLVIVVAAASAAEEARQRLPHRYQRLRYPVRPVLLMAAGNLAPAVMAAVCGGMPRQGEPF